MRAIRGAVVGHRRVSLHAEPSKGLAPVVVKYLGESLSQIKDITTLILVEQNFYLASIVGSAYFILDDGRVVHGGHMDDLVAEHEKKQKNLGMGGLRERPI